jgi:hypothetical protein
MHELEGEKMDFINFRTMLPLAIGLIAVAFITIGLRGLLTRKPLLLPTKWIFSILIPAFLPSLLTPFTLHVPLAELGLMAWAFPLLLILFFLFYWKITKGYSVYGANAETVRKTLLAAVGRLNLSCTENMAGIHLPSEDITLTVSSVMSMGQIRAKGKDAGKFLRRLAEIMNEEFTKPEIGCDLMPFGFYLAVGLVMVAMTYSELTLLQQIGIHHFSGPR